MKNSEPPSAPILEQAVLGAVLRRSELLDELQDGEGIFASPIHQILFQVMQKYRPDRGAFDLNLLIHRLDQSRELESLGGPAFIQSLPGQFQEKRLESDLAELRSFHARREAFEVGKWMMDAASNDGDVMTPLIEGQAIVTAALEGTRRVKTAHELVNDCVRRFHERYAGKRSVMGIPTHPELDRYLWGMQPGRVWVIGAYPSGGKSLLGSQFLTDGAKEDVPGAYLTLEMPEADQVDRMAVQFTGVSASFFRSPVVSGMNEHALAHMQHMLKLFRDSPFRVVRPKKRSIGVILSEIRLAVRELGARVVVVDYFQLVSAGLKGNRTREDEASEISHALQEVAGELGITLVVLTQLNSEGETKHGRVIEEDADVFLTIDQDRVRTSPTYKQHLGVTIVKDRHHGSSGTRVPLFLDMDKLRFVVGEFPTKQEEQTKKGKRTR